MKKIILLFLMAAMIGVTYAQEISFGLKGGVNMSNIYGEGAKDTRMKFGYQAGVAVDYELVPNVAIQSGLFLVTKGYYHPTFEVDKTVGDIKIKGRFDRTSNAMYLQLPVHLAYKVDVAPEMRLVLHAGPYVAYGVGGKVTTKAFKGIAGNVPSEMQGAVDAVLKELDKNSVEMKTFDKETGLKPFDAGVGVGIGAEFGSILVDLGWDMGLLNITKSKEVKAKNQTAYISLGYMF